MSEQQILFLRISPSHLNIISESSFENSGESSLWKMTLLPGKDHGQRSLAGCSPWGYMTEHVCMRVDGDGLVAINW